MGEKPQRIVTHSRSWAEQNHRDTLERNRVITGTECVNSCRLPLHEGERTIPCGERTPCEIEQPSPVLVGDFCAIETETT